MKVLFLDDEQYRHDTVCCTHDKRITLTPYVMVCHLGQVEVWHVTTAKNAIKALDEEKFDVVCLDHDLGFGHGRSDSEEETGMVVVDHICKYLSEDKKPDRIIVHSWNIPRSDEMVKRLKEKGFTCEALPFHPTMRF